MELQSCEGSGGGDGRCGEQEEDDGGGWVVAVDEDGGHRCGNVIRVLCKQMVGTE